jgi:hypothetical protein
MFDKIGQAAEKIAVAVSRRAFLGRLGQGAIGMAMVIAGVLASPTQARPTNKCCICSNPQFGVWCSLPPYGGIAPCPRGCTPVMCKQYSGPPYNCPT